MSDDTAIPDKGWYMRISQKAGVTPRCPYAHIMKCSRYFESAAVLAQSAGFASLDPEVLARAEHRWGQSPEVQRPPEDAPSVMSSGRYGVMSPTAYSRMCPEVTGERFGLFCTDLGRHVGDELDQEMRERSFERERLPLSHPRRRWSYYHPSHYTECLEYSMLAHDDRARSVALPRKLPFDALSGSQFEELVYAFIDGNDDDRWTAVRWVGSRGRDGGRDIWAIDSAGKSCCFMCANHHPLRLRKVREDLDSLVKWSRRSSNIKPDRVFVVAGDQTLGAGFRDDAHDEARARGWTDDGSFEVWTGQELEVKLRTRAPALAEQYFVRILRVE